MKKLTASKMRDSLHGSIRTAISAFRTAEDDPKTYGQPDLRAVALMELVYAAESMGDEIMSNGSFGVDELAIIERAHAIAQAAFSQPTQASTYPMSAEERRSRGGFTQWSHVPR